MANYLLVCTQENIYRGILNSLKYLEYLKYLSKAFTIIANRIQLG